MARYVSSLLLVSVFAVLGIGPDATQPHSVQVQAKTDGWWPTGIRGY